MSGVPHRTALRLGHLPVPPGRSPMACPTVGRLPIGLGHSKLPDPAIPITKSRDRCCGTRYLHASSTCTCTLYPRLSSSSTNAINNVPPCAWAKFGTFSKSIAFGFNRSTMAKKLRQRSALSSRGRRLPLLTRSPIFDRPAVEKGWHGGPPARRVHVFYAPIVELTKELSGVGKVHPSR